MVIFHSDVKLPEERVHHMAITQLPTDGRRSLGCFEIPFSPNKGPENDSIQYYKIVIEYGRDSFVGDNMLQTL